MLWVSNCTRNNIKSIGYASGSDRVNGFNMPQTSALENSAVAFNIVGTKLGRQRS